MTGRILLALFAAILASLAAYALSGITAVLVAIVQMPWRLATGAALRNLDRNRLAAEFSPAEIARRPPPSLVAVAAELRLGTIAWGALCLAVIVVGVALAGLGTEVFIGEHGAFSGAGITTVWPQR
jgi:hypothetical protein